MKMSLGGTNFSKVMEETFESIFNDDNVHLVATAGNSVTSRHLWPAAFDSVVDVTVTDANNKIARFSTYHDQVDIAFPGVLV